MANNIMEVAWNEKGLTRLLPGGADYGSIPTEPVTKNPLIWTIFIFVFLPGMIGIGIVE